MNAANALRAKIIDILGNNTVINAQKFEHFNNQKAVQEILDALDYEKILIHKVAKYAHKFKERDLIIRSKRAGG